MDILFLLVPMSVLLALGVMGVLAWAVWSGQFEELDSEGQRILMSGTDESLDTTDASLIHVNTSRTHLPHTGVITSGKEDF